MDFLETKKRIFSHSPAIKKRIQEDAEEIASMILFDLREDWLAEDSEIPFWEYWDYYVDECIESSFYVYLSYFFITRGFLSKADWDGLSAEQIDILMKRFIDYFKKISKLGTLE